MAKEIITPAQHLNLLTGDVVNVELGKDSGVRVWKEDPAAFRLIGTRNGEKSGRVWFIDITDDAQKLYSDVNATAKLIRENLARKFG